MTTNTNSIQQPVAIIGMGGMFAQSRNLKEYWRTLLNGIDCISDPPATHRQLNDYFHTDPKKPDHIYCNRGGFLPSVPFDPTEFGIPPASLEATDTSQLLGLVAAKMALTDAGYGDDREFDREHTSVILGVTGTQELVISLGSRLGHPRWRKALDNKGLSDEQKKSIIEEISDSYVSWQENSFPGLLGNVVAGRICNRLNLGGTNCVVDAACASSLGAVHLGLMELVSGKSNMVVTGGVDTINDIFMHMCFSKTGVLSHTGDARPFSADADGTVLGEGIGILVLKRLEDAERDADRIYAVIRGIGTSSDGKSQSIYAPRPDGQARALIEAYRNAGISPDTVGLVEAHGTGTRVGDEMEFIALKKVFGAINPNGNHCALGSVKSMIGHTKAAAGAAGLIKSALSLYNKVLTPTLKAGKPDPRLGIESSPFYLNTAPRPWFSPEGTPRRVGVSSFGFGGSNFHAVLEEYQRDKKEIAWDGSVEILAFSGPDEATMTAGIHQFHERLGDAADAAALSRAARRLRTAFSRDHRHRLILVTDTALDGDDLREQLQQAMGVVSEGKPAVSAVQGIYYHPAPQASGKIAFLFPGQGSQ
ncbi:MAG: beta-ketoacyl synthase N-terminal-like domain-containing protein, partial [Desulfobacteraceae bacterium]|nr:beta-ketoacyl synthase N-terminal-like domain-containing protein [Desulfobacteraceae bacterium]